MLPTPPDELIAELASRYIQLFERITGETFVPDLRPIDATLLSHFQDLVAMAKDARRLLS